MTTQRAEEVPSGTARQRRRETLLAVAIELFSERGFAAVGVDEIGEAAGITGPGVYRHFPSKQALLVALFDGAISRLNEGATAIEAATEDPAERLQRIVAAHVEVSLDDRALITVYVAEEHSVPEADRRRLRAAQRRYVESWLTAVRPLRPDLDEAGALLVCQAAIGLLNSVAFHGGHMPRVRSAPLLAAMALAALLTRTEPAVGRGA